VQAHASAHRAPDGSLTRVVGSITESSHRSGVDALTGLGNRAFLLQRMLERLGPQPHAVLLLDLCDFRMLNEQSGHSAADQVLLQVAVRLRNAMAQEPYLGQAVLARMGSDEFAVFVPCPDTAASALAQVVLDCFEEPVLSSGEIFTISATAGLALSAAHSTPDQMLRDADLALRQAQGQGRLTWCLFEPGLRNRVHLRSTLARDLRSAVERDQLSVVYQPKVHLRTGRVAGFEALLRWRHPDFGLVFPSDFIPLAEETGSIIEAGEWILRQACQQMHQWRWAPSLEISVNVSARQLSDPGLLAMVRRILEQTGNSPSSLALELTESSLIEEERHARRVLAEMREMGVHLMLDDFGTGYASLSYLNAMRFDTLKIDRSFISQLETDAHSATIVRTVLGLARELGMDVVAEGIETLPQLEVLTAMDCAWGQGYYFSKPVDAAQAEVFLRQGFPTTLAALQ
jgi:diguanylate cyclase (GGDEF)-like protein